MHLDTKLVFLMKPQTRFVLLMTPTFVLHTVLQQDTNRTVYRFLSLFTAGYMLDVTFTATLDQIL